ITQGNGLAFLDGFERAAGGDAANQRKLLDAALNDLFLHGLRQLHDFDRAALVITAPDEALFLEGADVFVDGGERGEFQSASNFFKARRVTVLGLKRDEKIKNFLLPFWQGHEFLRVPAGAARKSVFGAARGCAVIWNLLSQPRPL